MQMNVQWNNESTLFVMVKTRNSYSFLYYLRILIFRPEPYSVRSGNIV